MEKTCKYGICVLLIVSFFLYKIINTYKNTYIEAKGTATKEFQADSVVMMIDVCNYMNVVESIIYKHEKDIEDVRNFLLTKFNIDEIEEKGSSISDNLNCDAAKSFKIKHVFQINTKKIDSALKISTQLNELMKKNIHVNVYNYYFYKNIDKVIDELTVDALKNSKENAQKIATISEKKIVGLRRNLRPKITYTEKNYKPQIEYSDFPNHEYEGNSTHLKTAIVCIDAQYNVT